MKGDNTVAKDVKQGWQCPVCLTVYAPRVDRCECATITAARLKASERIGQAAGAYISGTINTGDAEVFRKFWGVKATSKPVGW